MPRQHSRVHVVVPMRDHVGMTSRLLRQLHGMADYDHAWVIDNGSSPAEREALDALALELCDVTVLDMPGVGIHAMWNAGLDAAAARDVRVNVAVLNNDVELSPGSLRLMSRLLDDNEGLHVIGANPGGHWHPVEEMVRVDRIAAGGATGLPGWAFMLSSDEHRFPEELNWWWGDTDMVAEMVASGRGVAVAVNALVEHVGGGSRTGDWGSEEMAPLLAADRAWFERKWAGRLVDVG